MSEQSKNKKILLGSALAGLVLTGPGLSLTSSGNFFQTAQLSTGYRLAKAETKETTPSKDAKKPAEGDKTAKESHCCSGKCGADGKCGKDGKDGSCGKDAKDHACGKEKTKANTSSGTTAKEKTKTNGSCGEGACGA